MKDDAAIEAFKLIVATLEPLDEDQRYRILGAVAVMFGFASWRWDRVA